MDKETKKQFNSLKRALVRIRETSYNAPDMRKPLKGYFFFIEDILFFFFGLYFFFVYGLRYLNDLLPLTREFLGRLFSNFVSDNVINFYSIFCYYVFLFWVLLLLWPNSVEKKKEVTYNVLRFWVGATIIFAAVNVIFYNVNSLGGVKNSFEIATDSFAKTLNVTLCYMDVDCYMRMKSQKTSSTSSDFYYSFSVNFPRMSTVFYRDGLKIPFDMILRTSTNVSIINYSCLFVKDDKIVGKSSYLVNRAVNSFKSDFVIHKTCELPENLSSGYYEMRVIVNLRANSHCKYFVYLINSNYFIRVNEMKVPEEITGEDLASFLRSNYRDKLLNEFPYDPEKASFVCSNDLITLRTSFSSQMPIFYDIEKGPFDVFIDLEKNPLNSLGVIKNISIERLYASQGISFYPDDFFNIEKVGNSYRFSDFDGRGSFVVGFEINDGLASDKSVESIWIDFSAVYSSFSSFKFYLKKT